jgi:hypothetical protein
MFGGVNPLKMAPFESRASSKHELIDRQDPI